MSNHPPVADLVQLSDNDVRLLYDIVSAAEQATELPPVRALYAAYDRVLAERGISKDNDRIYLRFLLRMGEARNEGQDLFEQFVALLGNLGIHVKLDGETQEADGDGGSARSTDSPSIRHMQTASFRPARRASFDSAVDTNTGDFKSLQRLEIMAARPASIDGHESAQFPKAYPTNKIPFKSALRRTADNQSEMARGRMNDHVDDIPKHNARTVSVSRSDGSRGQAEHSVSFDSGTYGSYNDSDLERLNPTLQDAAPVSSIPLVPSPDEHLLEEHARTLRFHHVAARAVSLFRHWRAVAEASHNQHDVMRQTAAARDAGALMKQAIEKWKIACAEEDELRETQKFYENLATRASQARNLFLLTKAFTHWAQCASEEVSRRTAARKHILRAKYFNAWRDITVVNELKVRRQRLSKIMKMWKKRTSQFMDLQDQAVDFRTSHDANQAYRRWFWAFCERRAPAWYTSRLQRTLFIKWIEAMRAVKIRNDWAVDFRALELLRQCIARWSERSNAAQDSILSAIGFRRHHLLLPTVDALQRDIHLAPLQSQFKRRVSERTTRSVFHKWTERVRIILEARRTNELRLMRNAWTKWNDTLRYNALARSIDDRILAQTLYQWALSERLALFNRVKRDKILASFFTPWHEKTNNLCEALGRSRHQARIARDKRSKQSTLKQWSNESVIQRQLEARADQFRAATLTTLTFDLWLARHNHVQLTNTWATSARFYVLTTDSLKTLQTATIESKKTKRRTAYSAIRRRVKMNTARSILTQWRTSTSKINLLNIQAADLSAQRTHDLTLTLLSTWHSRTQSLSTYTLTAQTFQRMHTLHSTILTLSTRLAVSAEASMKAQAFALESTQATASSALRRLSWHVFSRKRLDESAESFAQRTRGKRFRAVFRWWIDAPLKAKSLREGNASEGQGQGQGEIRSTASLGADSLGVGGVATPAYLRTPSRHRTFVPLTLPARLPARLRIVRNPDPTTPLPRDHLGQEQKEAVITPFMARLRERYIGSDVGSGNGSGSGAGAFGRSYGSGLRTGWNGNSRGLFEEEEGEEG